MTDLNKIKWRVVRQSEYAVADPKKFVLRNTFVDGDIVYEIGALPTLLPTNTGAIVVPTDKWADDLYGDTKVFFVRDVAGHWVMQSADDFWVEDEDKVREALDEGGRIVFDGFEFYE